MPYPVPGAAMGNGAWDQHMTTNSGTHAVAVTLASKNPSVVITGTVDADGLFATYAGQLYSGAVFGPSPTNFTLKNTGLIESQSTTAADAGIVLGAAGIIKNTGTVIGANGVAMFGGGTITNTRLIEGTLGNGIFFQSVGTLLNTGIVTGSAAGIVLAEGGYVQNAGNVSGVTGIAITGAPGGYVYNTGRVTAGTGAGISFATEGYAVNKGSITGGTDGIILAGGGQVYNYGIVTGGTVGVVTTGFASESAAIYIAVLNTGKIAGGTVGVSMASGGMVFNFGGISGTASGLAGSGGILGVYNYAAGRITGGTDGITLAVPGYVYNAGFISGTAVAVALTGGTVLNDGDISGGTVGVSTGRSFATVANYGTIRETANNAPRDAGISFGGGGTLINDAGGNITGATGVTAAGAPITIINNGYIGSSLSNDYAVVLGDGGIVLNAGSIGFGRYVSGYFGGVLANARATIENSGLLSGHSFDNAIVLRQGGYILNSGTIDGGIAIYGLGTLYNTGLLEDSALTITGAGTVTNTGTILTVASLTSGGTVINDSILDGVFLGASGLVDNAGTMRGSGVTLNATGTFKNTGTIFGISGSAFSSNGYGPGISLAHDDYAINNGYIRGYGAGASLTAGGTLINTGIILGIGQREGLTFGIGVEARNGATIINDGTIYGVAGIYMYGGGTLVNAGTILQREGTAVAFKSRTSNLLVDAPGAVFGGQVELGGGTLELSAGTQTGTASLALSAISGFTAITIDHGAAWEISSAAKLSTTVSVLNNGTLLQQSAPPLTLDGSLTGEGTIILGPSALTLDGPVAAGQNIDFSATGETLKLGTIAAFAGTIGIFAPGDTIDLAGILKTKGNALTFSDGVLTISNAGSPVELTFAKAATLAGETFHEFKQGTGIGITLTGPEMNFLPPPEPAKTPTQFIAIKPPAAAPPPASAAVQPAATLISTGSWAPHWPSTPAFTPPAVTLQT